MQENVAHESCGIQNRVGNYQRAHAFEADEKDRKNDPHDRVANEPAETLVKMVGAAKQGACCTS